MGKQETPIQSEIMLESGKIPSLRVFRNNNGVGFQGEVTYDKPPVITLKNYRRIRYGLIPGSGDLVGWQSVTITPDMVGQKIAQFVSVEVKSKKGKAGDQQKNWRDQVNSAGGKAVIIRSAEELREVFE